MNSETLTGTVLDSETKQGISKANKPYHLVNFRLKISDESGFKTSMPITYTHFINPGETPPQYKPGEKITVSIDSLEIDKRMIKITGVVI